MSFVVPLVLALVCSVAALPERQAMERIVGGYATTIDKYPYVAAVLYSPTPSTAASFEHICGGVIVSNRAVITAATCIFDSNVPDNSRVRVGSSNASTRGTLVRVSYITVNDDYVALTRASNIAMLRLAATLSITGLIQTAPLSWSTLAAGEEVWTVGFGDTTMGLINGDGLRHAQMWSIAEATCTTAYTAAGVTLDSTMTCAGLDIGGRGACLTDVGGPLVYRNLVVGIKSFSIGCGSHEFPGVYTLIEPFYEFITANM